MLQTSAVAMASIQVCMQLSCCCRHHGKSCHWWLYITEALTFLTRLQYFSDISQSCTACWRGYLKLLKTLHRGDAAIYRVRSLGRAGALLLRFCLIASSSSKISWALNLSK